MLDTCFSLSNVYIKIIEEINSLIGESVLDLLPLTDKGPSLGTLIWAERLGRNVSNK